MSNLTKRDLVVRISDETGLVQQDVMKVVQKLLDSFAESMAKGQTIELRNFGVFEVKMRKARVGRNPNKPEKDIVIPPRAVIKFKPGKELKAMLAKLTESMVTQ
ncbi:MAG TPA: HU family DNA-binding protein [Candidatus Methylacidiphilales bacterium]